MPLCSLYNTFNQINPNEIVLSFQALKITIYSVLLFLNILYTAYLLISISKTHRICGDMLILCIRKSHSVNYDLFRFNQSTYLESFSKYQYYYTINLTYFPYVNFRSYTATLIYVSSATFSQT